MENECESMTSFGCPARDYAKTLMLQSIIEGSNIEMCKKMCCKDCEESCGYRCGQAWR